ncbi:MAG: hypothetical protein CVT74_07435 [Alphaproteobacteria bacterium HGW-Alphaproteobacteria-13]|jgi:hypothetical protein|nr:MAG: hypothetical protein CVT74_07435 [Alphaproteobacteria bacterium HGW-Alphaproteobacteria-13]
MATIFVKDAQGLSVPINAPNPNGRAAAEASRPVALSAEDKASLDAIAEAIGSIAPGGDGGGDASAAKQDQQTALLTGIVTALGEADYYPATQPVSGPLTDAQLRAAAVPVSGPLTDAQLRASAVPVSAQSLPLPTGAASDAKLDALIEAIGEADYYPATQPVSIADPVAVTGPLTDAQLRAAAVPVSAASLPLPTGAATNAKLDALIAAIGALAPGGDASEENQLVEIGLLEAIANAIAAADYYPETQPVSGTVAVTGALTDAQLRAAALPLPTGAATAAKQDELTEYFRMSAGTDRSGTIAAGGVAQQLAPANATRKSLTVQNISDADLWVNEIGGDAAVATAGSWRVPAGAVFAASTNRAISIVAAAAGKAFTATEL